MISFKKINLNCPYYFFNDIRNVDSNLLSINKISYKNTDAVMYNIKYIMMESINNQNIHSENPLCLSFSHVDAYIIKKSGNKYLIFALTKNNKKKLRQYKNLWSEINKSRQ